MSTPWKERYATRVERMSNSAIRELLKYTQLPDVISFAGGMPAPELFPVEEMRAAVDRVLILDGVDALQYSTTEGYPPLREMIARHMRRYGIIADTENILITTGSQQALDLIGKVFINPGTQILTEAPTYLGALQAFAAYGAKYATLSIDADGMKLDDLEAVLRTGPNFIYALPNFQNPAGVTLSLERRCKLLEHAVAHGIPIVEDDPYGQLRFDGEHIKPLLVLDAERLGNGLDGKYSGDVIYLSTFSKTLAPGLRVGWVVAPKEVIQQLVQAKQGSDLHTSTLDQMVVYEVAKRGFLDGHVRRLREVYRRRRDVMLDALARAFPDPDLGVRWTRPAGGLFLWVTLPDGLDARVLLKDALKEKVAFVPGRAFFPNTGGHHTLRLNFSNATEELIEEGIARLGRVFARHSDSVRGKTVGGSPWR
ncbi:MAG: PLP-dependent aminotransferase family protein [Acidobacteriota bacterium]|nr:PLP-dependent aminotransferase family protein [Acidobacteriota bacterium]